MSANSIDRKLSELKLREQNNADTSSISKEFVKELVLSFVGMDISDELERQKDFADKMRFLGENFSNDPQIAIHEYNDIQNWLIGENEDYLKNPSLLCFLDGIFAKMMRLAGEICQSSEEALFCTDYTDKSIYNNEQALKNIIDNDRINLNKYLDQKDYAKAKEIIGGLSVCFDELCGL